jgi:hypothetical protein
MMLLGQPMATVAIGAGEPFVGLSLAVNDRRARGDPLVGRGRRGSTELPILFAFGCGGLAHANVSAAKASQTAIQEKLRISPTSPRQSPPGRGFASTGSQA